MIKNKKRVTSSVVIIFSKDKKKILFQEYDSTYHHRKFVGCLNLIGGGKEGKETPHQTICREVEEEIKSKPLKEEILNNLFYYKRFTYEFDCFFDVVDVFVSFLEHSNINKNTKITEGISRVIPTKSLQLQRFAWGVDKIINDFMGNSKIFCMGCFDLLHPGHIAFLNECKKYGGKLIVGIGSDKNIKKLKGKDRPLIKEKLRKYMLENISCVDKVIINKDKLIKNEIDYKKNILKEKPFLFIIPSDNKNLDVNINFCKQNKIQYKIIPSKHQMVPITTTMLKSKINQKIYKDKNFIK